VKNTSLSDACIIISYLMVNECNASWMWMCSLTKRGNICQRLQLVPVPFCPLVSVFMGGWTLRAKSLKKREQSNEIYKESIYTKKSEHL